MTGCYSSSPSTEERTEHNGGPATSRSLPDTASGKAIEDRWSVCHPPSLSRVGTELDSLSGFASAAVETYDLKRIGERNLPIVLKTGPSGDAVLLSQILRLRTDGTYRSVKTYRFRQGRSITTKANAETGQYRQNKDYVVIAGRRGLCIPLKRTHEGRGLTGADEVPPHGGVGVGEGILVYTRSP